MMLFVIFLYEPILVGYFRGTLGHKLMKLEVIRENGKKLGFLRAGVRYFLKSSLGVLSILSLMSSNQAIHDIVVKSFVVKK
ncbi:RDD family protein [Pseudobacteriovorax antillogorgiicola]|uniref:RDD family protein n=1 Tax=Pseudobacteriovorax antillogorgiicola TaxID=1513793 RepID=A0A1Y6CPA0_9BACT|nr:RDD family protein [Pseudobacteriovorax antillogorgiicola]TCS51617.1 RDD family protein [Pseudobacteriovorax antillogorgiicola]SMF81452.1 RDD family protein [Pseudobacteriovorax antillogorgiicola]